jgi:hypothetical protein
MRDCFRSVAEYPPRQDANGVLIRLIDGLGYRFYWATEGLTPDDLAFSPGGGCMTIGELVGHVWGLAHWVHLNIFGEGPGAPRAEDPEDQRDQILGMLFAIRTYARTINGEALFDLQIDGHPFWHIINGPLSDALTHTGQITAFRRLNGNVVPKHHVFLARESEAS